MFLRFWLWLYQRRENIFKGIRERVQQRSDEIPAYHAHVLQPEGAVSVEFQFSVLRHQKSEEIINI